MKTAYIFFYDLFSSFVKNIKLLNINHTKQWLHDTLNDKKQSHKFDKSTKLKNKDKM